MKIRNAFISNSSTTCYICEVCGVPEGGSDGLPLYEGFDMYRCVCGHIFHTEESCSCLSSIDLAELEPIAVQETFEWAREWVQELQGTDSPLYGKYSVALEELDKLENVKLEDFWERDFLDYKEIEENIPCSYCPICSLKRVSDHMASQYLLYLINAKKIDRIYSSLEDVKEEIRESFQNDMYFWKTVRSV